MFDTNENSIVSEVFVLAEKPPWKIEPMQVLHTDLVVDRRCGVGAELVEQSFGDEVDVRRCAWRPVRAASCATYTNSLKARSRLYRRRSKRLMALSSIFLKFLTHFYTALNSKCFEIRSFFAVSHFLVLSRVSFLLYYLVFVCSLFFSFWGGARRGWSAIWKRTDQRKDTECSYGVMEPQREPKRRESRERRA